MGIHQCPMDAKLDDEAERKIAAFQKSLNEKGAGDHVDFVRFEHESCVFFIQPAEHFAKMSDVAHSEAKAYFPQFQDLGDELGDIEFGVDDREPFY